MNAKLCNKYLNVSELRQATLAAIHSKAPMELLGVNITDDSVRVTFTVDVLNYKIDQVAVSGRVRGRGERLWKAIRALPELGTTSEIARKIGYDGPVTTLHGVLNNMYQRGVLTRNQRGRGKHIVWSFRDLVNQGEKHEEA